MKNATYPNTEERPIGFWIKAADRALDAAIDRIHDEAGLGRRGWQVLNTLAQARAPVSRPALADGFAPMLSASEVEGALSDLIAAGLVATEGDVVELRPAGRTTHMAMESRQISLRRQVMQGIDGDDYVVASGVLRAIARNLGA